MIPDIVSKAGAIERMIYRVAPTWAMRRAAARDVMSSFRGGVQTRLDTPYGGSYSSTGVRTPTSATSQKLRDRARNLIRNNALAAGTLDRSVENVIGTGIRVEPRTNNEDFNREVRTRWLRWCDQCDIRGLNNFYGLQAWWYRSKKLDGDIGVLKVDRGGRRVLQTIPADYIESPPGKYDTRNYDGVETNGVGRPIRYYIRTMGDTFKLEYTPINASSMLFYSQPWEPHGIRGVTSFAQSFWLFDAIDGYIEGTVTAAKAASYFSLVVVKQNASQSMAGLPSANNAAKPNQRKLVLEPGTVQYMNEGDDIKQIDPKHPTQAFDASLRAFARLTGLTFGLTIEQLMLDFSQTSYSSSRSARLQADQTAMMEQQGIYASLVRPIYEWWMQGEIQSGGLVVPSDVASPMAHEWIPQGKPWVDPTKEIQAAIQAIEFGLDTRSNVAMERGYDFASLVDQNRRDIEMMSEAGLTKQQDSGSSEIEQSAIEANAYGIAVRAGAITPQTDDELYFRERMGLPRPSTDVSRAWGDDEGTRRPITLVQREGNQPQAIQPQENEDADTP